MFYVMFYDLSQSLVIQAAADLSHKLAVGCNYLGPPYKSQPQSVTVLWPVQYT